MTDAVDRARRERERGDGRTWRERALDAEAERDRLRETVRYAKAVALVWAVHAMDDSPYTQVDMRLIAHPLGCVRAALDGETDAGQLGVTPDDLRLALAALDSDDPYETFRSALDAVVEEGQR